MEQKKTLVIQNVSKKFEQKKSFFARAHAEVMALRKVTLSFDNTGVYGLVGGSGAGKSTLARIIAGLEKPDAGRLMYNGRLVQARIRKMYRPQLVFQNPFRSLDPRFTIREIIAEGLWHVSLSVKEKNEHIEKMLTEMNLPFSSASKYPHALSGGERQRVAFARALIGAPDVLLLDEPVSSLDVSIQGDILRLIKEVVAKRSLMVIFISHDLRVVRRIAKYVFVMKDGVVVDEGESEYMYTQSVHPYTRALVERCMGAN